ncbi:MAG TPA: septum formation initiator family protein [bacterium]|nr:septum formation initiator family protein [bacterium]
MVGLLAVYTPGFVKITRSYARLQHYRKSIPRLEKANRASKAEIELLENDPLTTERLARQELGLIRPGEWTIRFEEKKREGSAGPGH